MNWKKERLGDVCSIVKRGIAPKYVEVGGVRVVNQKCIRDHQLNYEFSRRHNDNIKAVNPERIIQVGDVLVNSTGVGTLGRVAQVRQKPLEITTVDTHVTIVRPIPGIFHNDFFGYALILIEDEIKESGKGTSGQTELSRHLLSEDFYISFPESLNEQQKIATKLDAFYAETKELEEVYIQNLNNLQELNASFLQKAFSGELTRDIA